ncbi:MAG: NUDIX hydrolase [Polyangia bacterium]|jgi:8-oxo-dGTP pyrophosphatase MutT (NUDIX family)
MTLDVSRVRAKLEARSRMEVRLDGFRESAVLVPIVCEPDAPDRLLFTVRHAELANHAGQIAFPGGKRDPGDPDAPSTARRESSEELGIPPERVEVLGLLDDVPTPTGFVITPVVARVQGPLELRPNPAEVTVAFAVALDELRRPERYTDGGTRSFLGVPYAMHEYLWEGHRIWGATARVVHQLLELLGREPPIE